jgi:hypothetical protein
MREKRTEVVSLRLKPSDAKTLRAMAEADRRPFATLCAMILEDHVAAIQQRQEEAKAGKRGKT